MSDHLESKIFFYLSISIVFIYTGINARKIGAEKAVADGSFIQTGLCCSWTDERWQKEFSAMKEAGMHYLVIGAAAVTSRSGRIHTFYPSKLPNTEMSKRVNGNDIADICLRNAEAAGIKVFIGIGFDDKWWKGPGFDTTWFYNQMEFDNKVCDELYERYKNKYPNAFYGWYWFYEISNDNISQTDQNVIVKAMNMQLDHLTAANKKLPFMWCPYMNSELGTPEEYAAMWKNVFSKLHTSDGDIFAPQDCVGAGGLKLDEVESWFSELRKAVDTKPGLKFWSDVETFDHTDWTSATIDRYISQMEIEQPYVDNFITFAYCHYHSPYNTDSGYQTTYLEYLETGKLDSIAPSVPVNLKAKYRSPKQVVLNWDASSDNIGVCGYYILCNGKKLHKIQVRQEDDRGKNKIPLTSFTDENVEPNTTYAYQVQAFDFANNVSGEASIKLNTGN